MSTGDVIFSVAVATLVFVPPLASLISHFHRKKRDRIIEEARRLLFWAGEIPARELRIRINQRGVKCRPVTFYAAMSHMADQGRVFIVRHQNGETGYRET